MTVLEKANQYITPIIANLGYEVVEITYKKIENVYNLTFFIYKKGGISLDDCVIVNEALDVPLEELDITSGEEYTLNISSPGLDREIVTNDDLRRNVEENIEVFVKEFVNKKSKVVGTLITYTESNITLMSKSKSIVIDRTNIKQMRPYIKF